MTLILDLTNKVTSVTNLTEKVPEKRNPAETSNISEASSSAEGKNITSVVC